MNVHRLLRSVGRFVAAILWFRIPGGWIYYAILAAYVVFVATALWLLSRPGWVGIVGAVIVLLDGLTITLFLLHRWLNRRLRQPGAPG